MKIFKFLIALFVISLAIVSCSEDTETLLQEPQENFILEDVDLSIPNQYIVIYTENKGKSFADLASAKKAVKADTERMLSDNGMDDAQIIRIYGKTINGATLRLNESQVEALRNDSRVAYIEQDRIVQFAPPCGTPKGGPCDPGDGGGGESTQVTPYGIARVNGVPSYSGNNVAYVIDSGIDLDHPDLNVDASRGFNAFTFGKDGKSLDDGNGHGSHVSGTIAAINNDFGVIGVAPGATVVPVKVLDSRGSGSYSGVIAGVDFVGANGNQGDVANMSLGGPVSQALDDAVVAAAANGIQFTLAAGNESDDANNHSPARANGNNVYTISSMAEGDVWSSFSNFGNPPVDYCAPGSAVRSTYKNGSYATLSGTSMAAPHAAGVLLLGNASGGGTVSGDPDGDPDTIIVHLTSI